MGWEILVPVLVIVVLIALHKKKKADKGDSPSQPPEDGITPPRVKDPGDE